MPQTLDVKYLSPTKNVKGVLALGRSNWSPDKMLRYA
jgi:hypothetical protein